MECIRALFGAPEFADVLILQPEKHFADEAKKIPVYHDMHTAEWWWKVQVRCLRVSFTARANQLVAGRGRTT